MLAALRQRDPSELAACLGNDLQAAAVSLRPALAKTLAAGTEAGALAGLVSGSGPTCVFLCRDAAHAETVAADLEAREVCRAVGVAHGPVPGARLV
jgi:4-diphosphocytidyl-2-C-methyl-D-erythritol kinase